MILLLKRWAKFGVFNLFLLTLLPANAIPTIWKPTKYVWGHGFAIQSDTFSGELREHCFLRRPYLRIKSGDIVWVETNQLKRFYYEILPHIEHPFVLVAGGCDDTFPDDIKEFFPTNELLEHPYIIHIFAQNNALGTSHPKVSSIPIGLDFHTLVWRPRCFAETTASPQRQEQLLEGILSNLRPTKKRIPRAYIDFHFRDTIKDSCMKRYLTLGETRSEIAKTVLASGQVDQALFRMPRSHLWCIKGQYAFSISPHGNGLDCIRTWEDLVLGCIVIVKTSPLDCLYEGLPVVIVQDWSEITKANMKKWLQQYSDAFTNPKYRERLTNHYWMEKIREKATPFKQIRK